MANLAEGLLEQMNRVRELIKIYEGLPNGVGFIGASIMKVNLKEAEKASVSGDVVRMVRAHQELKGHE